MLGLMQRHPLLLSSIITHAARHHGSAEVVSVLGDGGIHRISYAGIERRARRLARALERLAADAGVAPRGRLYADTLSAADGPAPGYEAMVRHNLGLMVPAMLG